MSVPLRKDNLQDELTTADLAQSKRSAGPEEVPPKVVTSEPVATESAVTAFPSAPKTAGTAPAPLFPNNELDDLKNRWSAVQTAFVDEPRRAVEQADGLVASAMKRLAEVFAEERSRLEQQWDRGDNVSTEDLRLALQRYRSFFHRLLSI
jgi:hypothetical protein